MFEEIDYILEAQNAERFASLYACSSKYLPDIALVVLVSWNIFSPFHFLELVSTNVD